MTPEKATFQEPPQTWGQQRRYRDASGASPGFTRLDPGELVAEEAQRDVDLVAALPQPLHLRAQHLRRPLPSLPRTVLGSHGPSVGRIGLGCMGMSEFYGATDEAEVRGTLDPALELGVRMFDTADMYGLGDNERFLAPVLRAHREGIVIVTKFGFARTPERPDDWTVHNRPEYIRATAEHSLRRLGIDTIDLYYMHRRDPDVPLAESVGAMARLVDQGKVRRLGLSAVDADELRAAHAVHPIAALQELAV